MYSMIIQPVMIYKIIAWHQSQSQNELNWELNKTLVSFQNQCLWVITEAYWAAPASILKTEIYVSSLNLYLDFMIAWAIQHLEDSKTTAKIEQACHEICWYLQIHDQNQWRFFTEYIHLQPLAWGWQSGWIQNDQTAQVLQSQWEY